MNKSFAFLFPGQGSQYVGMMDDVYASSPKAREIIERADDILGYRLSKVCFDGPANVLQQTENTQPAIFLHSYVLLELLRDIGIRPAAAAGHSLGEYTALVAAEALRFKDGLRYLRIVGKAHHIVVAGIRTLHLKDAVWVFHERGIKEADAEIAAERPDDRDIAVGMHVARMPPLQRLHERGFQADPAQIVQAVGPSPGRAIRHRKTVAASASLRKVILDVGDHARAPDPKCRLLVDRTAPGIKNISAAGAHGRSGAGARARDEMGRAKA
jgi:hypothetical protein